MTHKKTHCASAWTISFFVALAIATFLCAQDAPAQARPFPGPDVPALYQKLLKQIDAIPIYDNHSHPSFADDPDVDAMASPPDASSVLRLRDTNPEWVAAAKALFGYPYDDFAPEHAKWIIEKKKAAEKDGGTAYFNSILDKLNIETCLANRVALAPYLDPKRFHWVFFADAFLFPLNNRQIAKNTDMAVYIPLQEKLLQRYMMQEARKAMPADLAGYEAFVRQTLKDNRKKGGVAMKFEAAYFRSLRFSDPPREKAEAIFAKYARNTDPPPEDDYRTFQDYIFRVLLDEAGKLHLPVHFHSAVGVGDYFSLRQGNPLNLESVLRDPRYRNISFVLLHGGYPYDREAIWMAAAKNVYLDSSLMGYYLYPAELKRTLKQWLELFPEKIMFGADAFPFNDAIGAEETFWLAVRSAQTALAAALAEMVSTGDVSEEQAMQLARMYLHDNAARLYGAKTMSQPGEAAKQEAPMKYTRWKDVELEHLNPLIDRQIVVGQQVMVARVLLKKGAHVPMHQHVNEQVTYILDGALKFQIAGKEIVVHAGEVLCIPPNLPHEAWAVEDTVDLDVFNPPREDWINKTDDYLRGTPKR